MNKVILTGRMVADPELKTTPSGLEVTSFRIAVNQEYAKAGEERKADFFNIVAWRKTAAFISQYFHKGDGINIIGRLQSRQYEASDGSNRYVVEVVADNVEFPLSRKSESSFAQNTYTPPVQAPPIPSPSASSNDAQLLIDDDLSF